MSPSTDQRENRELAWEVKFLIAPAVAASIHQWARGRLLPDPNAAGPAGDGYQITSLYFDTARFDVFQRNGSYGRSKYRIRRYGESEVVFLERKLKTRGLLTKRRSMVPLDALARLAEPEPEPNWPGFWFQRRMQARQLAPVCQISYHRTARVALTRQGPIRMTLDENLRAMPGVGLAFSAAAGRLLTAPSIILELKYRYEMPVLFKYLVEEFDLNPRPISKYRLALTTLGLAPNPTPAEPIIPNPNPALCLTS